MSSDGLRRTVVALALSLIVGVLASAALANSDVRRTLSPTLVLVVASFLTVLPLVAQATFLLLQSMRQGRRAVALPSVGVHDGWLVVLTLSALPSLFERDLAQLASPTLLVLNSPPALSLKLAVALTAARLLVSHRETRREAEGAADLLGGRHGNKPERRA
jgi:hypothetical protein